MKIHGLAAVIISAILVFAIAGTAFAQNKGHVQFVANIEFIKGHLEQAVANKQRNDTSLAKAHSGHPIAEHYSLIEQEVKEHNATLNTELKNSLMGLAGKVDTLSMSEFKSTVDELNAMLDEANESVISAAETDDPKFNAAVMISLLETTQHEYEEAVVNGTIKEMIEYQDATGFISRSKAVYDTIKAAVPKHEDEEIRGFFDLLDTHIEAKADSKEVKTIIGGIIHELEAAFELEAEGKPVDGWGYIERIKELLDQSLQEYEEGEFQKARSLAVEAYIDNYEHIEGDIEQDNPQLMEKIELELRVQLTKMIDERRPAAEIESHIEMVKTDLETARTVVVPEFPFAVPVLAFVASTILAGTLYARRKGVLGSI
jgi:hypothetical protein